MRNPQGFDLASGKTTWSAFAFLALVLVVVRGIGSLVLPIYDDAYITFRYGRNLAAGHGFAFDSGPPVLGTTSPLFGLLTAVLHTFRLPIEPMVIGLNALCDVLTLFVTLRAFGASRDSSAGALFGLFFALSPIATRIAVGGTEMNLFLALSVSSILLYFEQRRRLSMALAAASIFLRPEGLALVGLLFVIDVARRKTVRLGVIVLLVVLPSLAVIQWYFGHIIPQSVVAKSRQLSSSPVAIAHQFLFPDPLAPVLLALAAWGTLRLTEYAPFVRAAVTWGATYFLAYLILRPHAWSWYGQPVIYAVFMLSAIGAADLLRRVPRLGVWSTKAPALAGAGMLIIGTWIGVRTVYGRSGVTRFVYQPLQTWCRQQLLPGATILADDIGAIGYFSGTRIYDTQGLVWPAALGYKSTGEIVLAKQPDYLLLSLARAALVTRAEIGTLYKPVRRFSPTNAEELHPAPAEIPDRWVQDYILFERVAHASSPPPVSQNTTP